MINFSLSDLEEESVKHPDNLGNQLGDLLGHQTILDGASSPEKEPFSADLADLGRALFLEDKEKRLKRLYGARQGNQLGNTTTSHGNGILAGASLPCISSFQPHLGDAEPSRATVLSNSDHRVETWDNSWERSVPENCAIVEDILWDREEHGQFGREEEKKEQLIREQSTRERREREERELQEAENWPQQPEAITGRSHWLCEHYQRHCRVRFPCCTQFYPCHRCHNISKACDNEEVKACHATHLKCSFCQEEQEIGEDSANCRKCGGKMSAYFCAICKHFTSVYKNPYHCEKCGICRNHQNKLFHCEVCNVCLDKRLEGNHKCRPDSDYDQVFSEDAFSGCQILPCSHKAHRECANVAVTQNVIKDHNHGSCLCERCTSTREDEDKEVSLELPYAESSSSYSTQSQVDFDDNWAQPQTLSADASLESFTSSRCSNCSANSWIVPDTGEGIAPSFLLRHTQDEELSQSALSKLSILNDIPSKCISSSSIDPVTDVACESERAYPSFSDDCQDASYSHLDEGLESIFSVWSSGQCERQSVDEGSWAGAVRPHVGFPVHGAVGGVFNDPLAWGNAAFNGDCSTVVLEEEAGFDDDMFVWSSADGFDAVDVFNDTQVLTRELPSREASSVSDLNGNLQATGDDLPSRVSLHSQPQWDQDLPYVGARPRQAHYSTSASPNSQSQQDWNSLGARPREHQYSTRASLPSLPQQDDAVPVLTLGRQFPVTTDWLSPVARLQQAQYSYSCDEFDGGRGTEEDFEGGVTISFLLKHSQDKALRAWALHEQVLMEQDLKQLGTSIKREGKLVRKIRACEEEEDEELHEISSCTQEVRTAHKEPVHNCVNCNQIIDAQQQENHPCHPDICCICQEYVDAFIGCYEVPCGHKFHEECYLNMMVNNIETCPLCRRPF